MEIYETSRHHLAWPRRHYKSRFERDFRQHPLMIIRMSNDGHRELHANLQPPLKLSHQEILGALSVLHELKGEPFMPEEHITYLAQHLEQGSERAQKVATNLHLQAGFVALHGAHHELTRS